MNRLAVQRPHLGYLANDGTIQFGVDSQAVIEILRAIENILQFRFKLRDGKRFIRAKLFPGSLKTGATSDPNLLLRIAWSDKQRVFLISSGRDDRDRIRFVETGQVQEIGILSK